MPITPLPQFEADLEEQDRIAYEKLKPPTSMVVRFGTMKMIGEFPYDGDAKPGCGSKLVVRTFRGTEIGEMLTSTCPNAGCSKSITRKEMLEYIERSGGKDYPFYDKGRIVRVASMEDLNRQSRLMEDAKEMLKEARKHVNEIGMPIKVVEAEPIFGGERLTFYFTSEKRVDFRELVSRLARKYTTRIEMRQIGARDEARLVADYERCGQHCCCKSFLKVLKPVSMRMAKVQKATLDPLKISGRCGRLMCCLRYEDETYEDLRKRLPKRKTEVNTPDGPGIVIDTQILTQLVLVRLDHTGRDVAVAVEELLKPGEKPPPRKSERRQPKAEPRQPEARQQPATETNEADPDAPPKKKRRRRGRRRKKSGTDAQPNEGGQPSPDDRAPEATPTTDEQQPQASEDGVPAEGAPKKKRRRRRRRRKSKGGGEGGGEGGQPSSDAGNGGPSTGGGGGDGGGE